MPLPARYFVNRKVEFEDPRSLNYKTPGGRKMPDSFQIEMIVGAEPQRVFSAWMDSREHAAFTGGGEAVVEPWAGGRFIAWDGYIPGNPLRGDEGGRTLQTLRPSGVAPQTRGFPLGGEIEPGRGGAPGPVPPR